MDPSTTLGTYYRPGWRRADIEVSNLPVDVNSWGRSASTALPLGTVGSLRPTFVLARRVGLGVKLPCAFAHDVQSPDSPRKSLHTSVTFWEAYAP
ncbi:hypothetical protein EJ110_NYTH05753 [Nymphaea thermarum]|nr:hypothetical protein EJ110_NYTH05753 [Nymphaea thermarum]